MKNSNGEKIKYICQVENGWMLTQSETGIFEVVETGYPYPDTEKSNYEMMQSLFFNLLDIYNDINWYMSRWDYLKTYLRYCIRHNSEVDLVTMYQVMNGNAILKTDTLELSNIGHHKAIYEFHFAHGMFRCYVFCNFASIPSNEYLMGVSPNLYKGIIKSGKVCIAFGNIEDGLFKYVAPKYKEVLNYVYLNDFNVELELSAILEQQIGLNLRTLLGVLSIGRVYNCCHVSYTLDEASFSKLKVDMLGNSVIDFSGTNFSELYAKVLCSYVKYKKDIILADVCAHVNTYSSVAFSRELQSEVIETFLNVARPSIKVEENLYFKYVKIAAMSWAKMRVHFDEPEIAEILEGSYEGTLYALACGAKKRCAFYSCTNCYFHINVPSIGYFYKTDDNVRQIIDKDMVGMKPSIIDHNKLLYMLSDTFDGKIANVFGMLLQQKLSLSLDIENRQYYMISSIDESEIMNFLGLLFQDIERRLVFDSETIVKAKDIINNRLIKSFSPTNICLNVSSHIVDTEFNTLSRLFLNFSNKFFIRDIKDKVKGDKYTFSYQLCFKDNEIDSNYLNTSISDEIFDSLKLACKVDYIIRLVVCERILTKGIECISVDDIDIRFDAKTQHVYLGYSL